MRQFSLLTFLLCLLTAAGFAQGTFINGVVLNASNQPVANQVVYASDSTSNMSNPMFIQATTNASGQYSMQVPGSVPTGSTIHVWTFACGVVYYNVHTYSTNANITSNFSICGSPASSFTLKGNVTLGGTTNTGTATLYLINATYDAQAQDWILTALDTIHTTNTGGYTKSYNAIPSGNLLLKVALDQGHPSYASYMPTYYTSNLSWSGGTYLTSANFTNNANTNINMIAGVNPGGAGFIGGYVLQGANKPAGVGDPLASRVLLLTTAAGQAVGYTYTNAQGQFSFPNLAYGTYKIFGDAWGKTNPPLTVTISASQSSIANITFEENSKKFEGHIGGVSVGQLTTLPGVSVYPNPATDYVQLTGLEAIHGGKTVLLTGINGALISKLDIAAGQSARIPTDQLPAGVYLLQVHTEAGTARFKMVK